MKMIRYEAPRAEEAELTPFGQFMAIVQRAHGQTVSTMAGSALWSHFPVSAAIAAGLWVVMIGAAKKIGQAMTTSTDVLGNIAPRVDRLVNAGLLIRYGSVAAAAQAFELSVIHLIHSAIALGYRPGMEVPADAWKELKAGNTKVFRQALQKQNAEVAGTLSVFLQLPAALFFAELVKVARERGEEIALKALAFEEKNDAGHHAKYIGFPGYGSPLYWDQRVIPFLDLRVEMQFGGKDHSPGATDTSRNSTTRLLATTAVGAPAILDTLITKCEEMRALPADLSALPHDIRVNLSEMDSIDSTWLNTQILLAAGNTPTDREYILLSEFRALAQAANALPEAAVADCFWARMQTRNPRLKVSQLRQKIGSEIQGAVRRTKGLRGIADELDLFSIFCVLDTAPTDTEEKTVSAQLALDIICDRVSVNQAMREKAFLLGTVLPTVNWKRISSADAEAITDPVTSVVEPGWLVPYLAQMPKVRQNQVAQLILAHPDCDAETVGALIANKHVRLTWKNITKYAQKIPASILAAELPEILATLPEKGKGLEMRANAVVIFEVAARLDKDQAQSIFGQVALRRMLAYRFFRTVQDDWIHLENVNEDKLSRFHDRVGDELFMRFILATEVMNRAEMYQCPGDADLAGSLQPWQSWKPSRQEIVWTDDMNMVQTWARKLSEEDTFLWLNAADRDQEQKLAAYQRLREEYFANTLPKKKEKRKKK